MLANGTLLGFKTLDEETYTNLPKLKTIPDMDNNPDRIENTPISATNKEYEYGVGDYGDMEYTFTYNGNQEGTAYRMLRPYAQTNTVLDFQEMWTDGTIFSYRAIPSIGFKRGGGINTVVDLVVRMAIQSDIEPTDPT